MDIVSTGVHDAVVDKSDITRNLKSLQFESALEEDETCYLPLRARSHAISLSMCAQATYLTCILNEARFVLYYEQLIKYFRILMLMIVFFKYLFYGWYYKPGRRGVISYSNLARPVFLATIEGR